MGIYDRGRPKKVWFDGTAAIPRSPGEYRIRDKEQKISYIGETNNLWRRAGEHKRSGKFGFDNSFEFKVANDGYSSADRRVHERRSIGKHGPYLNKSIGGEGRPAKEYFASADAGESKPFILIRILGGLWWFVKLLLKIGIGLAIAVAILCIISMFI